MKLSVELNTSMRIYMTKTEDLKKKQQYFEANYLTNEVENKRITDQVNKLSEELYEFNACKLDRGLFDFAKKALEKG